MTPVHEDFQTLLNEAGPPEGVPQHLRTVDELEGFICSTGGWKEAVATWGEGAALAIILYLWWPGVFARWLKEKQTKCSSILYKTYYTIAEKAQKNPNNLHLYLHWTAPPGAITWGVRQFLFPSSKNDEEDQKKEEITVSSLLASDSVGFRGFMSWSAVVVHAQANGRHTWPIEFKQDGLWRWNGSVKKMVHQPGPIFCFHCDKQTDTGLHTGVPSQIRDDGEVTAHLFPPLTLFKYLYTENNWKADNGVTVNQDLIHVAPSFKVPKGPVSRCSVGKMVVDQTYLSYGTRRDYVRGLQDIISQPVLSMQQEWERDHKWTTYYAGRIADHSGKHEWDYVLNPTKCAPGAARDNGHDGFSIEKYRTIVNEHIAKVAPQDKRHIQLTYDEIIGLRLYTGPAYVMMNEFLREVSKLCGRWRKKLAQDPVYTYSATIGNVYTAIQKLAATMPHEKQTTKTFRGVRGKLPDAFFVPDSQGMIVAVDSAFMSTSLSSSVPTAFFDPSVDNLLWEMQCRCEDEGGYHCGVDVSLVSQFPAEREYLFPPLTMLLVEKAQICEKTAVVRGEEVRYQHVPAVPYFV
eukprot:TRINITY_DN75367_c0_g1_i1.p1 TRINITY_DN75367_c0_g1~~TRINITY_DN75367_c0_g1_i1.p1  ORF type:complete len:662 (+),score=42.20 TRINITY_DN75367_c0_g1_i1:263-1987(+)